MLLILARWAAELWLEQLNQRHVQAHAAEAPADVRDVMTPETYAKSVAYTLAKARFHKIELTYDAAILLVALFSGFLPWSLGFVERALGRSIWAQAAYIAAVAIILSAVELPLNWREQFHLEARFGFNTTTPKLWWTDRIKGLALGLILGYPLLVLILKLVDWLGDSWWLWAWGCVGSPGTELEFAL